MTTPTNPVPLGHYETPGKSVGIRVVGSTAYVADGGEGVQILDVGTASAPSLPSAPNSIRITQRRS